MTPRRIPSSASPDPREWQSMDEHLADLVRENQALKKEIEEWRAGVRSVPRSDSPTASTSGAVRENSSSVHREV
jgi:hypothetical protein